MKCKIASLNIRGLNKEDKMRFLNDYLLEKQIKICFLQETHFDSQKTVNKFEEILSSFHTFSSINENKTKGVSILISKNLEKLKIEDKFVDIGSRMINVEIKIGKEILNLINIYAPNVEQEQIDFIKRIYSILYKKKKLF